MILHITDATSHSNFYFFITKLADVSLFIKYITENSILS